MRRKTVVIVLGIILLVGIAAVFMYLPRYQSLHERNVVLSEGKKEMLIYIPSGSEYDAMMDTLRPFLKDRESFDLAAERLGLQGNVKPGRYLLKNGMTNKKLIKMIQVGEQEPLNISINRIRFKDQLASLFGRKLEADSVKVLTLLNDTAFLAQFGATPANIMGKFVSNTYQFNWNTNAEQVIERLVEEWDKVWTEEREKKAQELGLSPLEVMSLASIVLEEAAHMDEAPKIAGVYINRLEKGMALQADPTLKYIRLSKNKGVPVRRLYFKDLNIDSEYNTYKNTGLPPGPIILPELWAIDAVLDHEDHDYIFFVAKHDFSGYHVYARTFREHAANSARYRRELNRRNIR